MEPVEGLIPSKAGHASYFFLCVANSPPWYFLPFSHVIVFLQASSFLKCVAKNLTPHIVLKRQCHKIFGTHFA